MVYLNEKVLVDIKSLEMNILMIVEEQIENQLDYIHNITDKKKETVKNNIIKKVKKEIRRDLFLHRIMAEDRCTYKHNVGKKDGHFCHNKITKNGDEKRYLCRVHNKNHIPIKKIKCNNSDKNISINKSIHLVNNNKINYTNNNIDANKKDNDLYNNIICKYKEMDKYYNIKGYNFCNFKNIKNKYYFNDYLNNNLNILENSLRSIYKYKIY
jgi:hypothetical protein